LPRSLNVSFAITFLNVGKTKIGKNKCIFFSKSDYLISVLKI